MTVAAAAAASLTRAELIAKARTLPPSLLTFFARFPPPSLGPRTLSPLPEGLPPPPPNFKLPELPLDPFSPWRKQNPLSAPSSSAGSSSSHLSPLANASRFQLSPPFYGRRAQASIAALARKHGVEELLPDSTPKKTGVRERRRIVESGMKARLRGNAVSPVKGHKWERTLEERMELRKQAMLGMNRMIEEWKQLGYGRGWKTFPKRAGKK